MQEWKEIHQAALVNGLSKQVACDTNGLDEPRAAMSPPPSTVPPA